MLTCLRHQHNYQAILKEGSYKMLIGSLFMEPKFTLCKSKLISLNSRANISPSAINLNVLIVEWLMGATSSPKSAHDIYYTTTSCCTAFPLGLFPRRGGSRQRTGLAPRMHHETKRNVHDFVCFEGLEGKLVQRLYAEDAALYQTKSTEPRSDARSGILTTRS